MIDMKQLKDNVSSKLKPQDEPQSPSTPAPAPVKEVRNSRQNPTPMAIGSTIHIKGDVTGDEDLIIHGHVEGKIDLKDHNVIIGSNGKVEANINARQIVVEGKLRGDLNGEEKVIIRETGNVLGNVVSPRVTLEDGAMFKGSIEMEPHNQKHQNQKHQSENQVTNKAFKNSGSDSKAIA